jgi:hypothetical protein
MTTAQFDPNGGPLTAGAIFLGNMLADYDMVLREKTSNADTLILSGDNLNPENDSRELPTPAACNDGRRVRLHTRFQGQNPTANSRYEIRLEIYQDGNRIGVEKDTGTLTGGGQTSLLFIKLEA